MGTRPPARSVPAPPICREEAGLLAAPSPHFRLRLRQQPAPQPPRSDGAKLQPLCRSPRPPEQPGCVGTGPWGGPAERSECGVQCWGTPTCWRSSSGCGTSGAALKGEPGRGEQKNPVLLCRAPGWQQLFSERGEGGGPRSLLVPSVGSVHHCGGLRPFKRLSPRVPPLLQVAASPTQGEEHNCAMPPYSRVWHRRGRGCGPANVSVRPAGRQGHLREERGAGGAAAPIAGGRRGGGGAGGYRAEEAMCRVPLAVALLCPRRVSENS